MLPTFIQIVFGALVVGFPIAFLQLYLYSLKKKSNQIIKSYTTESSVVYKDLMVWVKNFDILEKANKFDLDPYQTTYDYNDCDLILNTDNLVVIGKTKLMGKSVYLAPSVFPFNGDNTKILPKSRIVEFKSLVVNGSDLEIGFTDSAYKSPMTLVIKRVDVEMKDKIITRYNKATVHKHAIS